MKRLIGNFSARYQTLLRSAAWGVLIVLLLVSLPFLFGPVSRGLDWVVSAFEQAMKGALMVLLTDVLFGLLFVLFSYWMVVARTRRRVLALTLAGVLVVALVSPPAAQAQGSIIGAIQSVVNVINGLIKTAMNSINSVRTAISNFYQQVTWPVALINQAKAMVTQMIGQYRSLMQSIFNINLNERHVAQSGRTRERHAKSPNQ